MGTDAVRYENNNKDRSQEGSQGGGILLLCLFACLLLYWLSVFLMRCFGVHDLGSLAVGMPILLRSAQSRQDTSRETNRIPES
jgi:hypothetical protein